MGLDPSVAVRLQLGEEAAAELAAIPDSEALRTFDEAVTRSNLEDVGDARSRDADKIDRMAVRMAADIRGGIQPDLAKASLAELLTYCVAIEKLAGGDGPNPSERDDRFT